MYFEAAAAITTLVLLGQVLELRARSRTSSAIRALLKLVTAERAPVRGDGTESTFPSSTSRAEICCACAPAKKFPSMEWCSKARVRSTNRL